MVTKVLIFVGGVAVGLVIADFYAKAKIQSSIDGVLGSVGLGGGTVQSLVDKTIVPYVQN